jgi:DNA-binding response OmpR family regulator
LSSDHVLVVSPDERWLRVLEVTLRLGGFEPLMRRSVVEALRTRAGDEAPRAIVLDLGTDTTPREVDSIREILGESTLPAIVILPERLDSQRETFRATGAQVLVRPYAPSALYAALRARESAGAAGDPGGSSTPPADGMTSPA